jgi:hypothetical protein
MFKAEANSRKSFPFRLRLRTKTGTGNGRRAHARRSAGDRRRTKQPSFLAECGFLPQLECQTNKASPFVCTVLGSGNRHLCLINRSYWWIGHKLQAFVGFLTGNPRYLRCTKLERVYRKPATVLHFSLTPTALYPSIDRR